MCVWRYTYPVQYVECYSYMTSGTTFGTGYKCAHPLRRPFSPLSSPQHFNSMQYFQSAPPSVYHTKRTSWFRKGFFQDTEIFTWMQFQGGRSVLNDCVLCTVHCAVLCCAMLYCAVLCCIVLWYVVLCCAVRAHSHLFKQLKVGCSLQELSHHTGAVPHKALLTEGDGFTLDRGKDCWDINKRSHSTSLFSRHIEGHGGIWDTKSTNQPYTVALATMATIYIYYSRSLSSFQIIEVFFKKLPSLNDCKCNLTQYSVVSALGNGLHAKQTSEKSLMSTLQRPPSLHQPGLTLHSLRLH